MTSKNNTKDKSFAFPEMMKIILEENRRLTENISEKAAKVFINRIRDAESIFFSAQGRAGFILRCFCMRLMHLGYSVYFCG